MSDTKPGDYRERICGAINRGVCPNMADIGAMLEHSNALAAENANLREMIHDAARWEAMIASYQCEVAQLTRERDEARADYERWHKAFLDAKYPDVLPTRVDIEKRIEALAADLALTREALDWALSDYSETWTPATTPPHLTAILDASRKRVCGHE